MPGWPNRNACGPHVAHGPRCSATCCAWTWGFSLCLMFCPYSSCSLMENGRKFWKPSFCADFNCDKIYITENSSFEPSESIQFRGRKHICSLVSRLPPPGSRTPCYPEQKPHTPLPRRQLLATTLPAFCFCEFACSGYFTEWTVRYLSFRVHVLSLAVCSRFTHGAA